MQYGKLIIVALAGSVLLGSACSTSRVVTEVESSKVQNSRDSVRVEQVMVAVHDTIVETTTITVDRNEIGDTLRLTTVTDRLRARDRDAIEVQKTKTEVVRDTVYVERRDSVEIRSRPSVGGGQIGKTALNTTLRWVFWIIIALTGFVIVIKVFNILK